MDNSERDPFNVELEMLREFYDCWREFHKIAKTHLPHSSKALAAQRMVDASNTIEAFRHPIVVGHG